MCCWAREWARWEGRCWERLGGRRWGGGRARRGGVVGVGVGVGVGGGSEVGERVWDGWVERGKRWTLSKGNDATEDGR